MSSLFGLHHRQCNVGVCPVILGCHKMISGSVFEDLQYQQYSVMMIEHKTLVLQMRVRKAGVCYSQLVQIISHFFCRQ